MKDGSVRITKVRPSYSIHRANIDVNLAQLKMYRASMLVNGFVVDTGNVLHGEDGNRFIVGSIHRRVNSFDNRPMSERARLIAYERASMAVNNGFHRRKQWNTLVRQACLAFVACKAKDKGVDDVELFPRDPYVVSFMRIIKHIGLVKFEMILRSADTNCSVSHQLISDAVIT
tara:strand:+ start:84 stop:602 length:519 start_codon:yes stop_codon:yes gene_type:complete